MRGINMKGIEKIEVVAKIPEEAYKLLKNKGVDWLGAEHILNAVANGTPLPKGHGRIIDETKINKCEQVGLIVKDDNITSCFATDAPTIIEAAKRNKYGRNRISD